MSAWKISVVETRLVKTWLDLMNVFHALLATNQTEQNALILMNVLLEHTLATGLVASPSFRF